MRMVMTLHDVLPEQKRRKPTSKYSMNIEKLLLSKYPYGHIIAESEKQAGTMASGFRRCIKDRAYPVQILKCGTDIWLIDMKKAKGSETP